MPLLHTALLYSWEKKKTLNNINNQKQSYKIKTLT